MGPVLLRQCQEGGAAGALQTASRFESRLQPSVGSLTCGLLSAARFVHRAGPSIRKSEGITAHLHQILRLRQVVLDEALSVDLELCLLLRRVAPLAVGSTVTAARALPRAPLCLLSTMMLFLSCRLGASRGPLLLALRGRRMRLLSAVFLRDGQVPRRRLLARLRLGRLLLRTDDQVLVLAVLSSLFALLRSLGAQHILCRRLARGCVVLLAKAADLSRRLKLASI